MISNCSKLARVRGFTLLEILIVATISIYILSSSITGLGEYILTENIRVEDAALEHLRGEIVRSFDSEDFAAENISSLAGEVPSGVALTKFSTATEPTYSATDPADWFAKLGRLRGFTVTTAAPAAQPALNTMLVNRIGRSRLLFAAPPEAGQQRYLLVSLYATSERLTMPAYEATAAWFDTIWNTEWNSRTAALPAFWASRLTTQQVQAWGGQLFRLRVVRIVQPRYKFNVSNGHATNSAWLYWNGAAIGAPSATAAPNSGAQQTTGILAGRLVRVRIGATEAGTTRDERRIVANRIADVIVE